MMPCNFEHFITLLLLLSVKLKCLFYLGLNGHLPLEPPPTGDFIKAKSWAQQHFALYAVLLRNFLRCNIMAQSVRAWRRA